MHKPVNLRNKIPSQYTDPLELVQLIDRKFRNKLVDPFQLRLHEVFYSDIFKSLLFRLKKDLNEANKLTYQS